MFKFNFCIFLSLFFIGCHSTVSKNVAVKFNSEVDNIKPVCYLEAGEYKMFLKLSKQVGCLKDPPKQIIFDNLVIGKNELLCGKYIIPITDGIFEMLVRKDYILGEFIGTDGMCTVLYNSLVFSESNFYNRKKER